MIRKFSVNGLLGILSGILGLINYLVFIKFEGLAALGIWATVSIIIIISQFVEYGLTDGVSREIASSKNKKDRLEFIFSAIIMFSFFGFVMALILYFNKDNFFELTKIDAKEWEGIGTVYTYTCICILLSSITSSLRAILYGLNLHTKTNLWMFICRLIQTCMFIYFIVIGLSYQSQVNALFIYLILMLTGCMYIVAKNTFTIRGLRKARILSAKSVLLLFSSSKEMFVIKLTQKVFIAEGFKIILSRFAGPEAVGAYSTAFNLSQIYRNMVDLGSKVFLNSAIEMPLSKLKESIIKVYKFVLTPLSISAMALLVVLKYMIFSYDELTEFIPVYYYLVPLVFAYSINVFATPLYYVVIGKKQFGILFKSVLLSFVTLYLTFAIIIYYFDGEVIFDLFAINAIPYVTMVILSSLYIVFASFNSFFKTNKA